jgi:hypothetical protein
MTTILPTKVKCISILKSEKVMEKWFGIQELPMKGLGRMIKQSGMGSYTTKTETSMKENGTKVKHQDLEYTSSRMETLNQGFGKKTS